MANVPSVSTKTSTAGGGHRRQRQPQRDGEQRRRAARARHPGGALEIGLGPGGQPDGDDQVDQRSGVDDEHEPHPDRAEQPGPVHARARVSVKPARA